MISAKGISKQPSKQSSLDYEYLRNEGIKLLQEISGEVWTDYNIHDPGVTILEVLCYALTDLGYQTEAFSDILASKELLDEEFIRSNFFTADQLLPNNPLSRIDFEKLIERQFTEVNAAWVESLPITQESGVIHGGYEVALFLQPDAGMGDPNTDVIQIALSKNRSVLEVILFDLENHRIKWDHIESIESCKIHGTSFFPFEQHHCQIEITLELLYRNIRALKTRQLKARITVDAKGFKSREGLTIKKLKRSILRKLESEEFLKALRIRLDAEKEKCELLNQIQRQLCSYRNLCENFISFQVVNLQEIFFTSEVVLSTSKNIPTEELINAIYDRLDNFFIEMVHKSKNSNFRGQRNVLYASNLIEEIIGVAGVDAAQLLALNLLVDGVPSVSSKKDRNFDCIQLKRFSQYVPKINRRKSRIILKRAGTPEAVDLDKISLDYQPLRSLKADSLVPMKLRTSGKKLKIDEVGKYYSIQNDFPKNYRLEYKGELGVVPPELMEKINQLKTYLFFFERLLLDHAHRLAGISTALSVYQTNNPGENELEKLTREIPGFELQNLSIEKLEDSISGENSSTILEEKHQLVDHLLARFATFYTAIDDPSRPANLKEKLESKISLLKDIPVVNSQRGLGLPLSPNHKNVWGKDLLSGLEKRIIRLLGLSNQHLVLQKLTEIPGDQPAGFYCVEHILLAQRWDIGLFPKKYNRAAELLHEYLLNLKTGRLHDDTYSFQLSILIPDWYPSWKDRRQMVESAIRAEVPAHILPHIHWLDKNTMLELEILLADWLEAILHLYHR